MKSSCVFLTQVMLVKYSISCKCQYSNYVCVYGTQFNVIFLFFYVGIGDSVFCMEVDSNENTSWVQIRIQQKIL